MGGCAGPVVLQDTEQMKKNKPNKTRSNANGQIVKKRKKCRPKQKTLDASSSPIAPDPEESNFMTAACLEELLKEEGIKSEEHVALNYLLDVMWETDRFRMAIQREIEHVFPHEDDLDEEGPRNPAEAENRIFIRAKSAFDYLELSSKVIHYLRKKGRPTDEDSGNELESGRTSSNIIFGDNESISVKNLSRLCNYKLKLEDLKPEISISSCTKD